MLDHVDRHTDKPLYLQLLQILCGRIESGGYLPGDRLPSESELCREFELSPMTVRRTIQALLDKQLVNTIKGSGTYVKSPNLRGGTFSMDEFYRLIEDGQRTKVKVLEARIVKAGTETASRLRIAEGERTILIRRLLIKDGDPLIYHREQLFYDPASLIVEAELEVTSLLGLFEGKGETMLKRGELAIAPVVLTGQVAELLNTLPRQPAFQIEHIFYDFSEKPVSWGQFICRGDRFRFTTMVGIANKG